ncbi:MAG: hypothetical protein V9H26_09815 [Verrucomicrobiota bacterium]
MALVAQRQIAGEKLLARLRANLNELRDREFLERRLAFRHARQILAHDAGVDLADGGLDLAGAKISHLGLVEARVRFAAAQRGDVWDAAHFVRPIIAGLGGHARDNSCKRAIGDKAR